MIILQETTKDLPVTSRHTYIVNDAKDKVMGYIKHGTEDIVEFSRPLRFSVKYRTFKEVK